jgi:hypothetical protein
MPVVRNVLRTTVRRNAQAKGLFGGSRGWMAVFVVMSGTRFLRTYVGKNPQYLSTETLTPGQSVTVTAIAKPSRKDVKKSKKAEKQARRAGSR